MDDTQDRRKQVRAPLGAWVEIIADGMRHRASAFDVSVGGMGVALAGAGLPAELAVVSEFPLPGIGLPLALAGRVVWSDPASARAGLRFAEMDPGLAELLASFVDGRLGD